MKIENNEAVRVGSLRYEDCFEYQGALFTVVDNAKVKINWSSDVVILVLCLSNNKLCELESNIKVKLKNLKVVVE